MPKHTISPVMSVYSLALRNFNDTLYSTRFFFSAYIEMYHEIERVREELFWVLFRKPPVKGLGNI